MDEPIKELVAMGAEWAAVRVGLMVNHGAEGAIRKKARKPKKMGKLSLHPLSLEEALKGAMETGVPADSPR